MLICAAMLIALHSVDGYEVNVNVDLITIMRGKKDNAGSALFTEGVNCLIHTSDGKYVTVVETCETVMSLIRGKQSG